MLKTQLQTTLRKVESQITLHELSKVMGVSNEDILIMINDNIVPEYTKMYKENAFKMPFWNEEKTKEFFTDPIIDIGMLVQHKIKEIYEIMEKKLNTFGHQAFYNSWIINRGY